MRYDGYTYTLSPCVLVWNNDMYYVVGIYKDKEGDNDCPPRSVLSDNGKEPSVVESSSGMCRFSAH